MTCRTLSSTWPTPGITPGINHLVLMTSKVPPIVMWYNLNIEGKNWAAQPFEVTILFFFLHRIIILALIVSLYKWNYVNSRQQSIFSVWFQSAVLYYFCDYVIDLPHFLDDRAAIKNLCYLFRVYIWRTISVCTIWTKKRFHIDTYFKLPSTSHQLQWAYTDLPV